MRQRSHIPSRITAILLVAAAHGLALRAFWRVPVQEVEEAETFTSILIPVPSPATPRGAFHARRIPTTAAAPSAPSVRQADSTTAITLPAAVPGAGVDWRAELAGAADAALQKEQRARELAGALTRKYVVAPDPRNPGRTTIREFRWYEAGIHRIDTRAPIPGLWLNDHCVLIAFVMPACKIGHIEIHGDLFDKRAIALDEYEATARPNDAP